MNILLTGGTGLIGSALIEACFKQDPEAHSFTVLTRKPRPLRAGVIYVRDLSDIPLETQFDAVINLAGEPIADAHWTNSRKEKLIASRVDTTQKLINFLAMLEHTPSVLISGSAVGWYGDQGDTEVNEDTNPQQEFTHELCRLWEEAALAAENFGMRVCLLRTGLVLSPKGGFLKRMLLPFKLGLGGKMGKGKHYMPWVHIDDLLAQILFLIHHANCFGAFNATAPKPVTNSAFTRELGKLLRRPTLLPMPAWFVELVFGEMSRLLLTGQNALPEKFISAGFTFKYADLENALDQVLKVNV